MIHTYRSNNNRLLYGIIQQRVYTHVCAHMCIWVSIFFNIDATILLSCCGNLTLIEDRNDILFGSIEWSWMGCCNQQDKKTKQQKNKQQPGLIKLFSLNRNYSELYADQQVEQYIRW